MTQDDDVWYLPCIVNISHQRNSAHRRGTYAAEVNVPEQDSASAWDSGMIWSYLCPGRDGDDGEEVGGYGEDVELIIDHHTMAAAGQ